MPNKDNRVVSGPLIRQALDTITLLNGTITPDVKLELLVKLLESILVTPPQSRSPKYTKVET